MITALPDQPEQTEKFRSAPWAWQATFETPLKDLDSFVAGILSPFPLDSGALSTDLVVFEPDNLLKLMSDASIHVENQWKFIIRADGPQSISMLLESAFGDWVDFLFVPSPESFAIYADHDEYATFYTRDSESLLLLVSTLEQAGFVSVPQYTRGGAVDRWR
jgi:hypothetical protein